MLDLAFESFETECGCGELRLSRFLSGAPEAYYVLFRTSEPNVFYFTDTAHMNALASQIDNTTPKGRGQLRGVFSQSEALPLRELETALEHAVPGRPARLRARFEPGRYAIRITLKA